MRKASTATSTSNPTFLFSPFFFINLSFFLICFSPTRFGGPAVARIYARLGHHGRVVGHGDGADSCRRQRLGQRHCPISEKKKRKKRKEKKRKEKIKREKEETKEKKVKQKKRKS
jgi:hypothetical protein